LEIMLHQNNKQVAKVRKLSEQRARTALGNEAYNELMIELAEHALAAKKNENVSYNATFEAKGPKFKDVSAVVRCLCRRWQGFAKGAVERLFSRAQLRRTSFLATCKRLALCEPGDEKSALAAPIGRRRTCDEEMEGKLVALCMSLKDTYHKIDDSMIIMVTAQVIAESAISAAEQQAALLRVRVQCALVTAYSAAKFGGTRWLKALKKRYAELRTFTVKRALEKERAAKVRAAACFAHCHSPLAQANPEGTANMMRMHVYGAALVQISKAVNSG
jgi:hypothetical protein